MANSVKIIRGRSKTFIVRLRDENDDPIDLTGATEIRACIVGEDGTVVEIKLSDGDISITGSPLIGKITVVAPAAKTALLAVGPNQDMEIVKDPGDIGVIFEAEVEVIAPICP